MLQTRKVALAAERPNASHKMRRLAAQFAAGTPGHLSSLLVTYCPILGAIARRPPAEPIRLRLRPLRRRRRPSPNNERSLSLSLSLSLSCPPASVHVFYLASAFCPLLTHPTSLPPQIYSTE